MASVPAYLGSEDWVTPIEAARYFGRSLRTIRTWLSNGTFEEFKYEVRRGPGRRVMIRVDVGRRLQKVKPGEVTHC